MKDLVQLLINEGIQTEEHSSSSYSYHKTHVKSFDKKYWIVKRSSKDSTSNEVPTCSRNDKDYEEVS